MRDRSAQDRDRGPGEERKQRIAAAGERVKFHQRSWSSSRRAPPSSGPSCPQN